jgi:hypothetical protein
MWFSTCNVFASATRTAALSSNMWTMRMYEIGNGILKLIKLYIFKFIQFMKMARRTIDGKHIAVMVPTVVSLLQSSNFLTFGQNGNLFVSDEVAKTHLFMLRQNLCSLNYYVTDINRYIFNFRLQPLSVPLPSR